MFYVSKLKQVNDKSLLLCLGCLHFCVDKTEFFQIQTSIQMQDFKSD